MVNFNSLICRNCKHFHSAGNIDLSKEGKCGVILEIDLAICTNSIMYCACNKFESSDNLIYLEGLSGL